MREMSATGVRTRVPLSVMSITSSDSRTWTAPTTLPLRAVVWMEITPCPPRRCTGYSSTGVRLPYPFSVAVRMSPSSTITRLITC